LTGGLIGTTATFSSSVATGSGIASGVGLSVANATNARKFELGYSTGAGYSFFQVYDGSAFQPMMINGLIYVTGSNVGVNTTSNNGSQFVIKGQNGTAASSGTTTAAVLRLSSGTGLYNVLDLGTNESDDYSWIQSTRANSLGTYDRLLIQPNGGSVRIGGTGTTSYKLLVDGTLGITGAATFSSSVTAGGSLTLAASTGFPSVGLLNRSSDNTLYMVSASAGFGLLDNSLNSMYVVTPTSHSWLTSNTTKMYLNNSGNLGVGVNPSAWNTLSALQVGNASLGAFTSEMHLSANSYYGSGWKYIATGFGARYSMNDAAGGAHAWYTAPSGTAGNAISFTQAMTLTSDNKLLINTTSNAGNYKLQVNGDSFITSAGSTELKVDGTNPFIRLVRNNNGNASGGINFEGNTAVKWQIGTNQATGLGFEINEGNATANRFYIAPGGAVTFSSSIKTGNPGLGSAGAIKLGQRFSGTAVTAGGYIPIDIDGTTYYINLFTTTP
jgi:hypothetical protein